jgi:GST-like protein
LIDLYTWATPNGRKASIMLEEVGLEYTVHEVNIGKDEQHHPDFLAINPNNKIPAIVDSDGPGGQPITVFESGAILIYLAEKVGSPLLPSDPRKRIETLQWLMFQMGGVGPALGQAHHFLKFAKEDIPYGKKRFKTETQRLYSVMDDHFEANRYFVGDDYTIADVSTYPWISRYEVHQVDLNEYEHVKRWFEDVGAREAVQKGMAVPFLN